MVSFRVKRGVDPVPRISLSLSLSHTLSLFPPFRAPIPSIQWTVGIDSVEWEVTVLLVLDADCSMI